MYFSRQPRTEKYIQRRIDHHQTYTALFLFIGFSLLYIAISRGFFVYGDDVVMYQVTESIVEQQSVAVASAAEVASVPAPDDVARPIPGTDGRGYAKYGIGQSLVAIPAYLLSDAILPRVLPLPDVDDRFGNPRGGTVVYGTALINAVIGGLVVALTFLLVTAIGYRSRTAIVVAALLAVATLLPHYAATFLSEPLTALCLVAAVYGMVRASGNHRGGMSGMRHADIGGNAAAWLAFAGFMAGLAVATRPSNAIALVVPALWLVWLAWNRHGGSLRQAAVDYSIFALPVILWGIGIAAYNYARFGSVLETGYGAEARAMYTTPFVEGLYGLLLSPGKGILWYNPPLALALAGSVWFVRQLPGLSLTIAGMLAGTLLLYSRYYDWAGGGVWGPRFLVPLLPLLLVPSAALIDRYWGQLRVMVPVVVVAAVGFVVTFLGIAVRFDSYVAEYSASAELEQAAIRNIQDSPIVVHAERLFNDSFRPDLAAVRYESPRLTALSWAVAIVGIAFVTLGVVRTFRPHRHPD